MSGYYLMGNEEGKEFQVKIPAFKLGRGNHLRVVK
jgi:uncharacterized protein affecting Mg2+/Co2+ transport